MHGHAEKTTIAKELGVRSVKKLVKATVSGLFGQYEHSIDFQKSNDFVIVYGPNGVGKTKFIQIVCAAQSLDYGLLQAMPFSTAELRYSDNVRLLVKRKELNSNLNEMGESVGVIEFELIGSKGKVERWMPYSIDFLKYLSRLSRFEFVGNGEWEDMRGGERYKLDELYRRYRRSRRSFRRSESEFDDYSEFLEYPLVFRRFSKQVSSYLIDTQRLLSERYSIAHMGGSAEFMRAKRMASQARINEYSDRLKDKLNKAQTEYSRLSQEKDRSFLSRVFKEAKKNVYRDPSKIIERYDEQNQFRDRLAAVVKVDQSGSLNLPEGQLKNWELTLLDLYLQDAKEKFHPFEDILERIELLQEILNKRLHGKRVEITAAEGLSVRRFDGVNIALDSLSTGEQHEIILMYDLLLNVQEGATVFIDEPEISLHVAWQLCFVPDVLRIAQLVGFRFVVATHSPQIINGMWDNAVEMGGESGEFE